MISCDTNDLIRESRCFKCIPRGSLKEIWIYLLCQLANGNTPVVECPEKVTNPTPVDLAVGVTATNTTVSWTAAALATSYDVYLNGVFVANTAAINYNFGDLDGLTPFTWRIDSVSPECLPTEGDTWHFTTAAALFSWEPALTNLDWTDGGGAHTDNSNNFNAVAVLPILTVDASASVNITKFHHMDVLTSVTTFNASNNLLTDVNASGMSSVVTVDFTGNPTVSINLTNCLSLVNTLYNPATTKHFNFTNCVSLGQFGPLPPGVLETLDMTGCFNIEPCIVNNNNLNSIILTGCTSLNTFTAETNLLTSLDLSGLNISIASFWNNPLVSLNVTGCTSLSYLACWDCPNLTSFDLSTCTSLTQIFCYNCIVIGVLDLTGLVNLTDLDCHNCGLTSLIFTGCPNLAQCGNFMNCSSNKLTNVDITPWTHAEGDAFFSSNKLTVNCVNNILDRYLVFPAPFGGCNNSVDTSLQNPLAPPDSGPPDGATAKATLQGLGWTVTTD